MSSTMIRENDHHLVLTEGLSQAFYTPRKNRGLAVRRGRKGGREMGREEERLP